MLCPSSAAGCSSVTSDLAHGPARPWLPRLPAGMDLAREPLFTWTQTAEEPVQPLLRGRKSQLTSPPQQRADELFPWARLTRCAELRRAVLARGLPPGGQGRADAGLQVVDRSMTLMQFVPARGHAPSTWGPGGRQQDVPRAPHLASGRAFRPRACSRATRPACRCSRPGAGGSQQWAPRIDVTARAMRRIDARPALEPAAICQRGACGMEPHELTLCVRRARAFRERALQRLHDMQGIRPYVENICAH